MAFDFGDFVSDLVSDVNIVDVATVGLGIYSANQQRKAAKQTNKIRQQELEMAKKQAAKADELAQHERRKLQYAKGIQNTFSGDFYGGYAAEAKKTQF